ncbi:hypothetical protein F0562_018729 [Nyssa sinensis]|uniref:Rx N-terminal domain-containing protein n=1 Tax=Nyssa sinensis TaxID=561372 RepID=A0A5J4ZB69_9ASTE|nr:hypothetical protein F0562_018729 [Nyssa sinensis]
MSTQRKREQRVSVFKKCLEEAMKAAKEADPSVKTFQEVVQELGSMESLLSKIKVWDDDLTKKFTELEAEFADGILEIRGKSKPNEIIEKLQFIIKRIASIKEWISFGVEVERRLTSQPSSPKKDQDRDRITSKEWSAMGVEAGVFKSQKAMESLQLSFNNLKKTEAKLCLLSFSIFPEICEIKKRPLIYWWIGEGLVTKGTNKTAEQVAEEIFQELISKGLINPVHKKIDPVDKNHSPIVNSCTVHPWIRRMLISIAKKAQFFNFDDAGMLISIAKKDQFSDSDSAGIPRIDSRRAFLMLTDENPFADLNSDNNNARRDQNLLTVFNVNSKIIIGDWVSKLRNVEVLQLGRWQSSARHHIEVEKNELLNGLGAQKCLRYLSLRGISRITSLPNSITGLISLEILDLRACHNLEKLPPDISELKNLTHLDISECYLLESMPKGLEDLSALQVLKGFVMGNSKGNACKLGDLAGGLKYLRKLSIYIRRDALIQEGEFVKLKDFADLGVLTISWDSRISNEKAGKKEISFPQNLRKLDLRYVPFMTLEWLKPSELTSLEKLYIRGGELNSLDYTNDGKKWNVRFLRLKYLKKLNVEKTGLQEKFPDAVYLEIIKFHKSSEDKSGENFVWNRDEEKDAKALKL